MAGTEETRVHDARLTTKGRKFLIVLFQSNAFTYCYLALPSTADSMSTWLNISERAYIDKMNDLHTWELTTAGRAAPRRMDTKVSCYETSGFGKENLSP